MEKSPMKWWAIMLIILAVIFALGLIFLGILYYRGRGKQIDEIMETSQRQTADLDKQVASMPLIGFDAKQANQDNVINTRITV